MHTCLTWSSHPCAFPPSKLIKSCRMVFMGNLLLWADAPGTSDTFAVSWGALRTFWHLCSRSTRCMWKQHPKYVKTTCPKHHNKYENNIRQMFLEHWRNSVTAERSERNSAPHARGTSRLALEKKSSCQFSRSILLFLLRVVRKPHAWLHRGETVVDGALQLLVTERCNHPVLACCFLICACVRRVVTFGYGVL